MAKHFRRTSHDKSLEHWQTIGLHSSAPPGEKVHSKHTVRMTVKAVCKLCNERWMSGVEGAAKPSLEPMLLGQRVTLSNDTQRALVNWIVLKAMVLGETDPKARIFTREETLSFSQSRTIPDGTSIWLFRTGDVVRRAKVSLGFAQLFTRSEIPVTTFEKANVETIFLRVGRLVIFVVHSKVAELELGKFRQVDAKGLWPLRGRPLPWPPMNSMSDAAQHHITETLSRFLSGIGANGR